MRLYLGLFMGTALLAGCNNPNTENETVNTQERATTASPADYTSEEITAETVRLNEWLDVKFEEQLDLSPMTRTYMGDKKGYDKIDDLSEAGMAESLEWRRQSVEELKAGFNRDKLTSEAQTSYDLWIYEYERAASAYKFRRNEYVIRNIFSWHTLLPRFLLSVHTVDQPSDMDAYISRIGGISRGTMQLVERAKLNAAAGSRPPLFAYDGAIDQARALISGAPFDGEGENSVWIDAQAEIDALLKAGKIDDAKAGELRAAAREALIEEWKPAYEEVIAWLEEDRPNADVIATGVGKNPNGEAYYIHRLAEATTTDMTPEEIHQLGLSEVTRIKGEMEKIKEQVEYDGTLEEFFVFVREDPQFYFPNTDEGRQAYIDAATAHTEWMKTRLPDYFGILPKADIVVKRVEPYREEDGGAQHYLIGSRDGSRPGVFYAHLSDMSAMPIPQLEVITYHEGLPGHHMQFSIAQELTNLPKFRTILSYNVFQEGWGLYTEKLAKEMGAYRDPYSDFGRLTTEIWRAIRLVVDTGLHAKGWTEEEAVQYFLENSPAAEGQIRSEIRRYITWPGQATGYKIGMVKMLELRERAETELGEQFNIKDFHDLILGSGQMPLSILERRVDEWIKQQQAK